MYVATVPFFPTDKRTYDIEDIKPEQRVMMDLYPEILQLHRMQRMYKGMYTGSECYAVYRIRTSAVISRSVRKSPLTVSDADAVP